MAKFASLYTLCKAPAIPKAITICISKIKFNISNRLTGKSEIKPLKKKSILKFLKHLVRKSRYKIKDKVK